ncbi:stress-inducible protein [Streptomyces bungoensis]|uniref:Stress-inducible protein n=1 Tax=Streptomyces bungoensis TaxID=285568 RepID=A0A101TAC3_9ACTN|nr:universal stress protein [Streptomyces bungoensis]KUN88659.1 stress-inducible protein [Streptomyces bungoensis]
MPRTITAGLDDSPQSLTAADWAAGEAVLRGVPLRLVHAGPRNRWADDVLRDARMAIARRHPGLDVGADRVDGDPVPVLLRAAGEDGLLVLGSRGTGGAAGFPAGSVALAALAGSRSPVVLVRGGRRPGDESRPPGAAPTRDVVLGLDSAAPDGSVIGFAFDAASRRAARLRVVHGRRPDLPYYDNGGDLDAELHAELTGDMHRAASAVLEPWREKFPGVEVTEQAVIGRAGSHLVEASHDASLLVVGRRRRRTPLAGAIGPVTQAVLHHATAPVAVVPHD